MLSPAVPVSVPFEVAAILRQVLRDEDLDVAPSTRLEDLSGWDSMHHIAALVEAECRFGIEFDLADIESVQTVGDLIDLVETKTAIDPA